MTTLAFAAAHSSERSVVIGSLGLRIVHYVAETVLQTTRTVQGLDVRLLGRDERRAEFHPEAGIYGYLDLRPGVVLIHINDPIGRYVERTAEFTVPNVSATLRALEQGLDPGVSSLAGIIHTVLLRPSVDHPVRSGQTSIWGTVRTAAGAPHPFARLEIATRQADGAATQLVTHADSRGQYRILFQNERAAFTAPVPATTTSPAIPGSITTTFARVLAVHVLRSAPAPNQPLIRAFPPDFDTLNPNAPGGAYRSVSAHLQNDATGASVPPGPPLTVPVDVGQNARWDVVTP